MANYIPLQLDKDTGLTRATRAGLSVGNPSTGFFRTLGYVHFEAVPISTWTVNHNAGTEHFNVQIFDSNKDPIIPNDIDIIDGNNTVITFTAPIEGKAVFIFFVEPNP